MKLTMTFLAFVVATALAIVLTISIATTKGGGTDNQLLDYSDHDYKISSRDKLSTDEDKSAVTSKRVSRFLAQDDARPKFHCNKDNDVCNQAGSPGSTCCNNKCIDVMTDTKNCGACKTKCKYTETCCNGQCVNVNFDKRNCGNCGKKCMEGGYCIYGMCDYA